MKSHSLASLIATLVFAVAGFFLLSSGTLSMDASLAFTLGLVIGVFLVPAIGQFGGNTESDGENADTTTLYVGNLPYRANEDAVKAHFSKQGQVESVRLMKDRRTGKRKGYGFVEMAAHDAQNAIKSLNDTEFQERTLKVRLAKDKVNPA